jgi:hypothetical protein
MPRTSTTKTTASLAAQGAADQDALVGAVQAVLMPLARLAVGRGLGFAAVEELLKQAFVKAADDAHADLLPHRRVSRVSTTTGIHRREVTRLIQVLREGRVGEAPSDRSLANEAYAHWVTNPRFRDRRGAPRVLPRQPREDGSPSFEELAQSVTRDVHPRSILNELLRLGMVVHDEKKDSVALAGETFVARKDGAHQTQVLGRHVGDHFSAAVENVLGREPPHLEQAMFANGLSTRSLDEVATLANVQWQSLLQAMVPALEAMVERDRQADGADGADGLDAAHRLRVGLYCYSERLPDESGG